MDRLERQWDKDVLTKKENPYAGYSRISKSFLGIQGKEGGGFQPYRTSGTNNNNS